MNSLYINTKKPKKFWKIIKDLIDKDDCVDIMSYVFCYPDNNDIIGKSEIPDFLNDFFANIAERTHIKPIDIMANYLECYAHLNGIIDFTPPDVQDIYGYMAEIDVNTASCVPGVNS